jgi:hypothetical protein
MAAVGTSSSLFPISTFLALVVARDNLHSLVRRSDDAGDWKAEEAEEHGLSSLEGTGRFSTLFPLGDSLPANRGSLLLTRCHIG